MRAQKSPSPLRERLARRLVRYVLKLLFLAKLRKFNRNRFLLRSLFAFFLVFAAFAIFRHRFPCLSLTVESIKLFQVSEGSGAINAKVKPVIGNDEPPFRFL